MKITINVREFKNNLKNLKLIKGEGLIISAKDSIQLISNQSKIEMNINCYGSIIESGNVFIPEETLKMMDSFKDGTFTITDKTISCENREIEYFSEHGYKLLGYEFDNLYFTISPNEFKRLLGVSYACKNDDARPGISGICIKDNKFIALNGFLGGIRYSDEFDYNGEAIISEPAWKILKKLKSKQDIKVFISKEHIRFVLDDITLDSKLISDRFFKLNDMFIKCDKHCTVNVNELLESIKIMEKIQYSGNFLLVKLTIYKDELMIECEGLNNTFKDTLKVESNIDKEFNIAFNIKYLKLVLSQYEGNVDMQFTTYRNPLIIKSPGQADLVLPILLKELK